MNESSFLLHIDYSLLLLILYSASRASHMAARDVLLGRNGERKGVKGVRDVCFGKGYKTLFMGKEGGVAFCLS